MNDQDKKPYIDANGTIVIPFNIDKKYHFWNGGQPLSVTLQELNVQEDTWHKHIEKTIPRKCGLSLEYGLLLKAKTWQNNKRQDARKIYPACYGRRSRSKNPNPTVLLRRNEMIDNAVV